MSEDNGHEVRDSKEILKAYGHQPDGQGMYVMMQKEGELLWCPSGNEMRRIHELNPEAWLTGPIYLQMSKEDYERFHAEFDRQCDNF